MLVLAAEHGHASPLWIVAEVAILAAVGIPLLNAMYTEAIRRSGPKVSDTTKAVFTPGQVDAILEVATETVVNHPTTAIGLIVAIRREGRLASAGIHAGNGIRSIEETARIMHAARGLGGLGSRKQREAERRCLVDGEVFIGPDGPIDPDRITERKDAADSGAPVDES